MLEQHSGLRLEGDAPAAPPRGADGDASPTTPVEAPEALRAASRELSGLRLLLDQLDELLRDPTLTRALRALTGRLTGVLRGLAAAFMHGLRKLPRLQLRLPRRLLLALLALILPLALLALLNSGDDERATRTVSEQAAGAGGAGFPGLGMPEPAAAQTRPQAVRVAIVLDRRLDGVALRRELGALGAWLAEHHSAGTRVTVIDAQTARASAPLRASELSAGRSLQARPSTTAAIREALGGPRERRLLVSLGAPAPALAAARTLSVTVRAGAPPSVPTPGRRSRVQIDALRPNALAASVARAIMGVSRQSEQR